MHVEQSATEKRCSSMTGPTPFWHFFVAVHLTKAIIYTSVDFTERVHASASTYPT